MSEMINQKDIPGTTRRMILLLQCFSVSSSQQVADTQIPAPPTVLCVLNILQITFKKTNIYVFFVTKQIYIYIYKCASKINHISQLIAIFMNYAVFIKSQGSNHVIQKSVTLRSGNMKIFR